MHILDEHTLSDRLGLFIAHQHMQDHGGTIDVKSKVKEGTTFTLTLPVSHSA